MQKKLIRSMILVGLFSTPAYGLYYWLQVLPPLGVYVTDGPHIIAIKATKDILICMIFLTFLLGIVSGRRVLCNPLLVCMCTLLSISFVLTASEQSPTLALIGLRGLSPLLLVFVAYKYLDMGDIRAIVKVLVFLLFVELCAAWIRVQYALAIHGTVYLGLATRPSGTFAGPSSWAIFLCVIICYLLGFDVHMFGRPRKKTWLLVALAIVLILSSLSGTGLLALAGVLACYSFFLARWRLCFKVALVPVFLVSMLGIVGNLTLLTGRAAIYRSLGTRLDILADVFLSAGPKEMLIGKGLGMGSNVAVTVARFGPFAADVTEGVFIADSLYTSLMAQTGIPFLTVFVVFNLWVFRRALAARYTGINPVAILAIPAFCLGGATNVTIEIFPVNWLLCIVYGLTLKRQETPTAHCCPVPS